VDAPVVVACKGAVQHFLFGDWEEAPVRLDKGNWCACLLECLEKDSCRRVNYWPSAANGTNCRLYATAQEANQRNRKLIPDASAAFNPVGECTPQTLPNRASVHRHAGGCTQAAGIAQMLESHWLELAGFKPPPLAEQSSPPPPSPPPSSPPMSPPPPSPPPSSPPMSPPPAAAMCPGFSSSYLFGDWEEAPVKLDEVNWCVCAMKCVKQDSCLRVSYWPNATDGPNCRFFSTSIDPDASKRRSPPGAKSAFKSSGAPLQSPPATRSHGARGRCAC
jgi:hypothetical protein